MGEDTETLLAFDLGEANGWSYWTLSSTTPITRLDYGLVPGGLNGLLDWLEVHLSPLNPSYVVCEKFETDGRPGSIVGVPGEGAVAALARVQLGIEVDWQTNVYKRQVSDDDLRAAGLWLTAKADGIPWKDADDVNDSQRHALAWAKTRDHQPTIAAYWPDN